RQVGNVPCGHDQAARVRVAADLVHHPAHLVDLAAVAAGPAPPLLAVHRPELAVFVRPLVPDRDLVLAQVGDVGLAFQEPQQLVHDRAQVQLLRGHQRETLAQVETELPAEHAARAGAGAVVLVGAVLEHVAQQVEVLAHLSSPCPGPGPVAGSARCATSTARTGPARPAAGSAAGPWSTSRTRGSRA